VLTELRRLPEQITQRLGAIIEYSGFNFSRIRLVAKDDGQAERSDFARFYREAARLRQTKDVLACAAGVSLGKGVATGRQCQHDMAALESLAIGFAVDDDRFTRDFAFADDRKIGGHQALARQVTLRH
jgi:hypothetical protein